MFECKFQKQELKCTHKLNNLVMFVTKRESVEAGYHELDLHESFPLGNSDNGWMVKKICRIHTKINIV